jgi:hypothetical protein
MWGGFSALCAEKPHKEELPQAKVRLLGAKERNCVSPDQRWRWLFYYTATASVPLYTFVAGRAVRSQNSGPKRALPASLAIGSIGFEPTTALAGPR